VFVKNFIIYRKPDEENITQFNIEKVVSESEFVKIGGFVMAPFDIKSSALYFTGHETEYKAIQKPVEKTYLNKRKDDVKYKSAIDSAISSVQNNALQKVVVSRQILLDGKLNAREVFFDLLENQKNAFVYYLCLNDVVYIGASPEVLIKKTGNTLNSASLAGTVAKSADGQFNPWTEKEYHEHKLVTETIANVYERHCKKVLISDRGELSASNVKHLFQSITGELKKDQSLFQVLKELHPTPAIAGIPRDKAINWITQNERYDRDYYAGYLGVYSPEKADLFVNLRCLKYQNEITTLYVGGGIVEGSTFEGEYQETKHKAETLLSSIRKFHTIKLEHE